jgi:hypothetical protein
MADKEKQPFDPDMGVHLEILLDLPASIYRGIGRIVTAHAFLETQVLELFCEVSLTDYNVGRVAFRYQSASERFKTIRRLLVMHGIKPSKNLKSLFADIEQCCRTRDSFAHGLWVRTQEGLIAHRLTKGEYETKDGKLDRSFIPQTSTYSQKFFHRTQAEILDAAYEVAALKDEVASALKSQKPFSAQNPEPDRPLDHNPEEPPTPPQSSQE